MDKQKKYIWVGVAIAIVLLFKTISKWLNRITGNDLSMQVEQAQQQLQSKNYFDPNLWGNYFSESVFDKTNYQKLAENINDAIGYIYDDESAIFGVLQQLPTGCSVSYLSYTFWKIYNQSLLAKLQSNFTDQEMIDVSNVVSRKPLK